jgi:hypothetical protein
MKKIKLFVCTRKTLASDKSFIKLQRGVIRTNCIDSLDRTNDAQELIGYFALHKQLEKLGIIKKGEFVINNPLFEQVIQVYDTVGDKISL